MSATKKVVATVIAGLAVLGMVVYSALGDSQAYRMVDQVYGDGLDHWEGKTLRLHGWVEAGSIEKQVVGTKTVRTFVLERNNKRISVHHEGVAPDTFKDLAEVVAKGRLVGGPEGGYTFRASELSAKCPSKYEGASGALGKSSPLTGGTNEPVF